jgi:2-oxo-4-hydroxy-4-carboxy-5-ureidoimidazoline decarboxylase
LKIEIIMTLHELNTLPPEALRQALFNCCGCAAWVEQVMQFFPVDDIVELLNDAEDTWYQCSESDWLEAFTHHPKIGDIESLKKKFAATAAWAGSEQGAVAAAPEDTLRALAAGNDAYEMKFGFIFIVCATGKSAAEMLALLEARLPNSREEEIRNAMEEQNKITRLRLQKLLE